MHNNNLLLYMIVGSAMVLSVALKKLTVPGALTGGLLATSVYAGAGFTGIALLGMFFILGTAATAFKRDWKESAGISKRSDGQRTAGQVLANGGVAGILGIAILVQPQQAMLLQAMMAASLASAAADTVSSELGVVFGRRFINIRTIQTDRRGRDGVISWEGTLFGIGGSFLIALVYAIGFGFTKYCIWIVVAGTFGNLSDSLLGATLERVRLLNNNAVNFLNTLVAALVLLFVTLL
jgi:uncharacterized protein (TIGR00297 family)